MSPQRIAADHSQGEPRVASKSAARRRVAVLDADPASSEHARRAIRALGHSPLLFSNADELRELGPRAREFAMVLLGCPEDHDALGGFVNEVLSLVGPDVPMLFGVREDQLRAWMSHCRPQDDVVVAPSSFAKRYQSIERFMGRQGIPVQGPGLQWGPYRFVPATGMVEVDGAEVGLQPMDFDLAVELFHNLDRTLSRDRLRLMTAGCDTNRDARWIDQCMLRIRRTLDLSPERGWRLDAVPWKGYQLSTTSPAAADAPAAEHELSPSSRY